MKKKMSIVMKFKFKITKKSKKSQARTGIIQTAHGEIETPAFVTVATNAVVKGGVDVSDLEKVGAQTVLANTYHLFVRGQVQAVKKAGGLGKLMSWDKPTWTDSGGYQVFSLGQRLVDNVGKFKNYDLVEFLGREKVQVKNNSSNKRQPRKSLVTIKEKGVEFRSHLNGQLMKMSPEDSMRIQSDIGADMIFSFDVPTSPVTSHQDTKSAVERTHRWAKRCLTAHKKAQSRKGTPNKNQVLFGIVQGGPYEDLRELSAKFIADQNFQGFGIGGSYHRPNKAAKFKELDSVIPYLPDDKPRHFLGIGGIEDILVAVKQGIDTFDCVIPTREARHGRLYLRVKPGFGKGFYKVINIGNSKFKNDSQSINKTALKNYSRSYLYHLFKTQELLGVRLATINNLEFYFQLMADIRSSVTRGKI